MFVTGHLVGVPHSSSQFLSRMTQKVIKGGKYEKKRAERKGKRNKRWERVEVSTPTLTFCVLLKMVRSKSSSFLRFVSPGLGQVTCNFKHWQTVYKSCCTGTCDVSRTSSRGWENSIHPPYSFPFLSSLHISFFSSFGLMSRISGFAYGFFSRFSFFLVSIIFISFLLNFTDLRLLSLS